MRRTPAAVLALAGALIWLALVALLLPPVAQAELGDPVRLDTLQRSAGINGIPSGRNPCLSPACPCRTE